MAVGYLGLPELYPVAGVRIGTTSAGVKTPGRADLVLFEIAAGSSVAATFTQNAFCAAPVTVCKQNLAATTPRYLLVNTGNANAGTGPQGMVDSRRCCREVAAVAHCAEQQVLPFSTGVIGEPLPVECITAAIPAAFTALTPQGWVSAASGIMTTDTLPKGASERIRIGDREVTITGIAKGSGMIHPNMATMLAYIATDAAIEPHTLQQLFSEVVRGSFNRVSVDGDTSTNDSAILMATGHSGVVLAEGGQELALFKDALLRICVRLAQLLVRDGEGATKFIALYVSGGVTVAECEQVAFTVAHSPLVKTALFASDPNWGRILAAVGRAGVDGLDVDTVTIHLGEYLLVDHGGRATSYSESQGQSVMDREEITIHIDLGRGAAEATVWSCDLSYDYVRINADYRS